MEISGTIKNETSYIKYTQGLLLGIFIITWSSSSQVLFSNSGKYVALLFGLIVTIYSSAKLGSIKKNQKKIIITNFIYLLMLFLAFANDQETLSPLILGMSIITLILFLCGLIIEKSRLLLPRQINKTLEYSIYLLVILTSVSVYLNQASLLNESSNASRQLGEDQGNAVGLAYTYAMLVIFMLWTFSFEKSIFLKSLAIIAVISAFSVIIITLSRGVILYLGLLAITLFIRSLKSSKFIISFFIFILTMIAISQTFENDLIQIKFEGLTARFDRLFENSNDQSVEWRKNTYAIFVEEWPQFIFGQWRYNPYPHNQFLEIFMRWGIFGVPLLIVLFVSMKRTFIILIKRNKYPFNSLHSLFAMLLFFCFFQSMSSLSLEMNRLLWFGYGFFLTSKK